MWDELKAFWSANVNFLESKMDTNQVIGVMHQLTLLIHSAMNKYYTTAEIAAVLVQALKHCVTTLVSQSQSCVNGMASTNNSPQ